MRTPRLWMVGVALVLAGASCARSRLPTGTLVPNLRPIVELSTLPQAGDSVSYLVQFTWYSSDPDGRVVGFRYAVDPPMQGDTAWVETAEFSLVMRFRSATMGPPGPTGVMGTDYHVFAIEAIDNLGLASAPSSDAFVSTTVAPTARITFPTPNRLATAATPTSLILQWTGSDPDGPGDRRPLKYKYRLQDQSTIQRDLGLGSTIPSPTDLQRFFGAQGPGFTTWDSAGAESTSKRYEGLSPGLTYFFAVVAFDEAGAYDPRFDLDRNLARFRPSTEQLAPRLVVSNDLLNATSSSMDLSEARVAHAAIPGGESIRFDWVATPPPGGVMAAYRWILDPVNGDLSDETQRQDDTQTYRWSGWALESRSAILGPFAGSPGADEFHRFYVEARDQSGNTSIVAIELRVVFRARPMLVIDDVLGPPDLDFGPTSPYSYQPYGNYPTEAVLDTLLYAVGGKPYRHRPPGTLSLPGMFAGFDYDTLDYRFRRGQGLSVEDLFRYRAVVIYTTLRDATTGTSALSALRYATWIQKPNPLAAFVAHGGSLWVFGDGIMYAFLLKPGDSVLGSPRTPVPGQFAYDYMKLHSAFGVGGGQTVPANYLLSGVPFLVEHATPGRAWPHDTTRVYVRGSCDDPRVGPAAVRNRPRWDGLPCLDLSREFLDWPSGFPIGVKSVPYVAVKNSILEDLDPTSGVRIGSALDTLYLYRAGDYIGNGKSTNPDGKPAMCAYEGLDSGPVVWCTMPLWYFDRQELQQLARVVLGSFGITPQPSPTSWTGPGSANRPAGATLRRAMSP